MPNPPCSICLHGPKKDQCIKNWYGCNEIEDWPNFVEVKVEEMRGSIAKCTLIDCPTCRYLRRRIDERNKN
jgi:hypothetical protein